MIRPGARRRYERAQRKAAEKRAGTQGATLEAAAAGGRTEFDGGQHADGARAGESEEGHPGGEGGEGEEEGCVAGSFWWNKFLFWGFLDGCSQKLFNFSGRHGMIETTCSATFIGPVFRNTPPHPTPPPPPQGVWVGWRVSGGYRGVHPTLTLVS